MKKDLIKKNVQSAEVAKLKLIRVLLITYQAIKNFN